MYVRPINWLPTSSRIITLIHVQYTFVVVLQSCMEYEKSFKINMVCMAWLRNNTVAVESTLKSTGTCERWDPGGVCRWWEV